MSHEYHAFAGNPLDRGERERRDERWIIDKSRTKYSKFMALRDLDVLISGDSVKSIAWLAFDEVERLTLEGRIIFLGMTDEIAHFAVDVTNLQDKGDDFDSTDDRMYEDARTAAGYLSGPETGMLAQARSQLDWNRRHVFCSVCGHITEMGRGGQVRICTGCQAQHFPRTDPVVIMVVYDRDRCLLGQSKGRLSRTNTYSALAGFIDQGESIEEAVRREVREEAGIFIKDVRYHSSQPWPFPSSLMIGCHAKAVTKKICMDKEEMTDVSWFSREEVLSALASTSKALVVPGPIAIAHHLIKAWADGNVT